MATVEIKISGPWARHLFPCAPDFIVSVCRGRCCEGTGKVLVSLLPREEEWHRARGHAVEGGLLRADPKTGKCPHKTAEGLCSVHDTAAKPFGCVASPFTLNRSNTLIIRHRYSRLRCHGRGEPAYKTFRASLDLILGMAAPRVVRELERGSTDITANISTGTWECLTYLDSLKHKVNPAARFPSPGSRTEENET